MKQKELIFIILIIVLQTGCKSNRIITESVSSKTDSTSVMNLNENLQVNEFITAESNTELQRKKDENINLNSETFKHEIFYADSPVDSLTGRSQIISEVLTINSTSLDRRINVHEQLLQDTRLEMETLATMNSNLELTVERLINEQKSVKTKSIPISHFYYGLLFISIGLGIIIFYSFKRS